MDSGWGAGMTGGGKEERRRGFRRRCWLLVIREGRGYRPSRCISLLRTVVRCADLNVVRAVVVRRHVRQRDRHAGIVCPRVAAELPISISVSDRPPTPSSMLVNMLPPMFIPSSSMLLCSHSCFRLRQIAQRAWYRAAQHVVVQPQPRQVVQGAQVRYRTRPACCRAGSGRPHLRGTSSRPGSRPSKPLLCSHRSFTLVRHAQVRYRAAQAVTVDDQPRHVRWQHVTALFRRP